MKTFCKPCYFSLYVLLGEISDHPNLLYGAEIGKLLASIIYSPFL